MFGKAGRSETPTDPAPLSMVETVVKLQAARAVAARSSARAGTRRWAPDWLEARAPAALARPPPHRRGTS